MTQPMVQDVEPRPSPVQQARLSMQEWRQGTSRSVNPRPDRPGRAGAGRSAASRRGRNDEAVDLAAEAAVAGGPGVSPSAETRAPGVDQAARRPQGPDAHQPAAGIGTQNGADPARGQEPGATADRGPVQDDLTAAADHLRQSGEAHHDRVDLASLYDRSAAKDDPRTANVNERAGGIQEFQDHWQVASQLKTAGEQAAEQLMSGADDGPEAAPTRTPGGHAPQSVHAAATSLRGQGANHTAEPATSVGAPAHRASAPSQQARRRR